MSIIIQQCHCCGGYGPSGQLVEPVSWHILITLLSISLCFWFCVHVIIIKLDESLIAQQLLSETQK